MIAIAMKELVDPYMQGRLLRSKLVKDGKVLVVDFEKTLQLADIRKRNDVIVDVDTNKCVYRAKINCKLMDDVERAKKGKADKFDPDNEEMVRESLREEFDMPLWFLRAHNEPLNQIKKWNMPLIYQMAGCNFHAGNSTDGCIYCFVDNESNYASPNVTTWLTAENIVNTFENISEPMNINHLRGSGGETTLTLDHTLDVLKIMRERGYEKSRFQFDSNLSTGKLIDDFIKEKIYPENILGQIADYDPKVLVAFKGSSNKSVRGNTQSNLGIMDQIQTFAKLVDAGLDCYPYIYNPNPKNLLSFVAYVEKYVENFGKKLHVGRLNNYETTKARFKKIANETGMPAEAVEKQYVAEWKNNYEQSIVELDSFLKGKYGVGYKETERPSVKLKVLV